MTDGDESVMLFPVLGQFFGQRWFPEGPPSTLYWQHGCHKRCQLKK
jgi:hypothetical protein